LTSEELKKTYSSDNVWNSETQPLPPLPQLTGFGRYRCSTNAPKEWQLERAEKDLFNIASLVVNHLGDCPPAGMAPEIWKDYKIQQDKAYSTTRRRQTGCGYKCVVQTQYVAPKTGTKVTHGFAAATATISPPPSAASSFKDGSCLHKRDSNESSNTSPSKGSDYDCFGPSHHSSRSSFGFVHPRNRSMSPTKEAQEYFTNMPGPRTRNFAMRRGYIANNDSHLWVTDEEFANLPPRQPNLPPRKIAKPCEFSDDTNNDDAWITDDDEEY
jgi:hypothetical protein